MHHLSTRLALPQTNQTCSPTRRQVVQHLMHAAANVSTLLRPQPAGLRYSSTQQSAPCTAHSPTRRQVVHHLMHADVNFVQPPLHGHEVGGAILIPGGLNCSRGRTRWRLNSS